jgi:ribosomal-protein-alanine N-acetyltransferase
MDLQISRAQSKDIRDLKMIEIECGLSPWTIAGYESELKRGDSVILTARIKSKGLVGFLTGRIPLSSHTEAQINNLGTLPGFRKLGVGSALLREFQSICTGKLASVIWLEVRSSNRVAIAFYRTHGFVSAGVRPNFYTNPAEDAELMSLSLV